jgi:hypothetical protein
MKETIITYNKEDCEALEVVARVVERIVVFAEKRDQSGVSEDNATEFCVHSDDVKASKWRKFTSPVAALEAINAAAHWDYQRDRVYVRNGYPGVHMRLRHHSKIDWSIVRATRSLSCHP